MADVAQPEVMDTTPTAPASEEVKTPAKRGGKGRPASAKAEKTPKTKATKTAAAKKQKAGSDLHPKYSQMINEAIAALKERNGSSRQAILKYILANYSSVVDEKLANNHLKMSLRAGVKSGKLRQSKGSGANGSYKLGEGSAKAAKPKTEKASKSPSKKASLTKVKVPKTPATTKAKSPSKKAKAAEKASPKKAAKKSKSPAKKASKAAKSPKKAPAKKAAKSPKKTPKTQKAEKSMEAPAESAESAAADAPAPEPAEESASE